MFGFSAKELIVALCILLFVYAISRYKKQTLEEKAGYKPADYRKCLICNNTAYMKTWFDHLLPLLAAIVLLCIYVIPGLIFIWWGWGKYRCPNCGALGKNVITDKNAAASEKLCPFCAETIKRDAIVCKHCGRDLPQPAQL